MKQQARTPQWEGALEYATRFGWYVFPIEPPRPGDEKSGKRPFATLVRHGKDDATNDPVIINQWWSQYPECNVGVAVEPSNLCVFDVDIGHGKRGRESLMEFDAHIPQTLTQITGGGGLHAIYARDDGPSIQSIGFRDGLDLIGKGYIVLPPSKHYTGGEYRWCDRRPIVPLPGILRHAATVKAPKIQREVDDRAPIPPGGRNIALYRLGATLRDQGIGVEALASALHWENQKRCTPPLDDIELKAIVDSIMTRVKPGRDVAAGAVVADEIRMIVEPKPRAQWAHEVSHEKTPPMRFYPTGFDQLDILTGGGLATRQVCGVIGPPSAGKSGFVGSIVQNIHTMIPVLHISTELPKYEMFVRDAARVIGFPWRDGVKGMIPDEMMQAAVKDLRVKYIGSDDIDRVNPLEMIAVEAQKMAAIHGTAPAIVVDYVTMLARGQEDIRGKVGELTMGLRILSQSLDCPLLAVFSCKREFYGGRQMEVIRESNDPTAYLVAAKESGDIEFDCATLLFLDLDKLADGQPKPARVAVARCRVGDVGFAGARAKLDTGKWWGDAEALTAMSSENKTVQRYEATFQKDQLRVYEVIAKLGARPWREIANACAMSEPKAKVARARLIEEGKIEMVREVSYDASHRAYSREVIRIRNSPASAVVPLTNAEPTPTEPTP